MLRNETQYLLQLSEILRDGERRDDRTGVGTLSKFGLRAEYDLKSGFPLLTTKRVYWKGVVHELLWFLRGGTNVKYLQENGVHIWDEWADGSGDLGPIYGHQWRSWPTEDGRWPGHVDQIAQVISTLRDDPFSRRMVVSAWNVGELHHMALPPCHLLFQFYVDSKGLSCQMYQRSADMFLGVPFNIASYSLLTIMVAHVTGYAPNKFIHIVGDGHIYLNHIGQVREQLSRDMREPPRVVLNKRVSEIDQFIYDDIELLGYDPHPAIKAEVAV